MKIPGYKDWSYTGRQIARMIEAGRDIGCGRRGRKPSLVPVMRRLARESYKEKDRMYRQLFGRWCAKHDMALELRQEGDQQRWRCPACRVEVRQTTRRRQRADPVFRAAEKLRYHEWVKKRRGEDPVFDEKYKAKRYASHKRRLANNPQAAMKHKAILKEASYRRRALEDAAPLIAETLRLFWETYAYCLKCGGVEDLTIDHVLPLSKGGGSEFTNLQCLCRSCNSKKSAKLVDYRVRILVQHAQANGLPPCAVAS